MYITRQVINSAAGGRGERCAAVIVNKYIIVAPVTATYPTRRTAVRRLRPERDVSRSTAAAVPAGRCQAGILRYYLTTVKATFFRGFGYAIMYNMI